MYIKKRVYGLNNATHKTQVTVACSIYVVYTYTVSVCMYLSGPESQWSDLTRESVVVRWGDPVVHVLSHVSREQLLGLLDGLLVFRVNPGFRVIPGYWVNPGILVRHPPLNEAVITTCDGGTVRLVSREIGASRATVFRWGGVVNGGRVSTQIWAINVPCKALRSRCASACVAKFVLPRRYTRV